MQIDIQMLDDRILPPSQASAGSAGFDLRACSWLGAEGQAERIEGDGVVLLPGQTLMIGTGIAVHLKDPNLCALLLPRSGLGSKHGVRLRNSVGLLDSDYIGPVSLAMENSGTQPYILTPLQRIGQLVIFKCLAPAWKIVAELTATDRGTGGFGSSGSV